MGAIAKFQTNPDFWFSAYLKPSLKSSLFDAVLPDFHILACPVGCQGFLVTLNPDPWIHRRRDFWV